MVMGHQSRPASSRTPDSTDTSSHAPRSLDSNESGTSSHEAYKSRQNERVRMRLFREKDDPLPPD